MQKVVLKEILTLTGFLIENGLSVKQNFPKQVGVDIVWASIIRLSPQLKRRPYMSIYEDIEVSNNYNIKLLDGALLQFSYRFDSSGHHLQSHRLAFYPSPNLERYEDQPQAYNEKFFGESQYHDMLETYIVTFPMRFDFDIDETKHVEPSHPRAHVHFGEFENCRIPLSGPITPFQFLAFILRNFYFLAFDDLGLEARLKSKTIFQPCITDVESTLLHMRFSV